MWKVFLLLHLYAASYGLDQRSIQYLQGGHPLLILWQVRIGASARETLLALTQCHDPPSMDAARCYGMPVSREHIFSLLQTCMKQKDLFCSREVHLLMISNGFNSLTVFCDHLIRAYATCGSLLDANLVFCNVPIPTSYTWQAIISAHVSLGENDKALHLYQKMQQSCVVPSNFVLSCALKACASLEELCEGKHIHDYLAKTGHDKDVIMGSALIDMYGKCGSIVEARNLFDYLPNKNIVSWGAIITCYTLQNLGLAALDLFEKMQEKSIEPDQVTLLCVLKACGSIGALEEGRIVHEIILRNSYETNLAIGNTLVDLYARCGSLKEARSVFDALPIRSVVSCGAMIAGYAQFGLGNLALELFKQMHLENIKPNKVVHLCILKACSIIGAIDKGMLIHEQIVDSGFDTDVLVGSTLIDMYAKCGGHEEAHKLLDDLPGRDVISWGAVISGYAQDGQGLPALELFDRMQEDGVMPDKISILCALKACSNLGGIDQARLIHKEVIRNNLADDLIIGNTLVDMYAKCGSLEDSQKVLDTLRNQDIISWNAMIAGYAQHGRCGLVSQCFENIQERGLKPDDKTYTSILAGCSHAGLLEQGHHYFKSIERDLGILPGVEVYSCMADLLGRSGCLEGAIDLLHAAPSLPEVVIWKSLLTSCRTYKSTELGRWAFDQILRLDSHDAFGYVLMSNMYADANMWELVEGIQNLRNMAGAEKKPGLAWIETQDKVHEFTVNSSTHPLIRVIHDKLLRLQKAVRGGDHLPQLDLVFGPGFKGRLDI